MPNTLGSPTNALQRKMLNPSLEDSENAASASTSVKGTVTFNENVNVNRKIPHNGTGSVRMNMAMQRGGTNLDDDEDDEEDLLDDEFDDLLGEGEKRKGKKTATQSLAEFLATSGPEDLLPAPPRFGDEKTKKNRGSLFFRRGKVKNKILANNDASGTRGFGVSKGKKFVALIPEFPLGKISSRPSSPSASRAPNLEANSEVKPAIITSPIFRSQEHGNRTVSSPRPGHETRPGTPRLMKSQLKQAYPSNSSDARTTHTKPDERTAHNVPQHKFDRIGSPGPLATENFDSKKMDESLSSSRDGSGSDPGSRRLVSMLLPPPPTSPPPARAEKPEANKGTDAVMDVVRRFEPKQRGNTSENEIARQQVVFDFQQRQRQRQQNRRQQAEMYPRSNPQMLGTQSTSSSPIVRARVAPNKAPRLSLSLTSLGLLGQGPLGDFLSPISNAEYTSNSTEVRIADGSNSDSTSDKAAPSLPETVDTMPSNAVLVQPLEDGNAPCGDRQGMHGTEQNSAMQSAAQVDNEEEDGPAGVTADSPDISARSAKKVSFMKDVHLINDPAVEEDAHQSIPQPSTNNSTMEDDSGTKLESPAIGDVKPSIIGSWDETVEQSAGESGETMTRSRSSSTLIDVADMNDTVGRELAARGDDSRSERNGSLGEGRSPEATEIESARSNLHISASIYRSAQSKHRVPTGTDSIHPAKARARKRVRHVQVQTRTPLPNGYATASTQTETLEAPEPPSQALLGFTAGSAESKENSEQRTDQESLLKLNQALRLEIAAIRAQLAAETRAKQKVIRTMEQTKENFDALSARAYEKLKEVLNERDAFEEAVGQLRERLQTVM